MDSPWMAVVLVSGVILLTPLADRIRVPQPVLLTIFGLGVGLLPFTEPLAIDPHLILPVVLPPLLFAATQRTTVREFRDHAGAVLTLAIGLTVSTAVVVALVAHAAGLPWGPAWVLGAIVSPPDPVAATAVARRLRLPERLVTILEGEGMFNDATALVLFKVTLAAVVTGVFSFGETGLEFLLAVVVGTLVGLALGLLARFLIARIRDAAAETTVTVLLPFVAYVGAEHVRGSGVLAVLALGLLLRSVGHQATTSQGWLLGRAVWSYADFLITSLVFAILGYELTTVIRRIDLTAETVVLVAAVTATVIGYRAAYIYPAAWVSRRLARTRDVLAPIGWREATVVSWAGMRGVVTVAAALALPATTDAGDAFPERDSVIVAGLVCVLVTLVLQGLTLTPLTSRLGVAGDRDEAREFAHLRTRVLHAGLEHVRSGDCADVPSEIRHAVEAEYEGHLAAQRALDAAVREGQVQGEEASDALRGLLARSTDVERDLVLTARRRGEVGPGTADAVLHDIEARAIREV